MKDITKQNQQGKHFEQCFIRSIPDYCWHKRLNDNAASWSNGTETRFTSTNECDFLLFDCKTRTLTALELKSTSGSLTFWREDFEEKGKKKSFNIKKNQVQGLQKWSSYLMNCGLIINFRNKQNRTFYIPINEFIKYTSTLDKKSINMDDVLKMNPIEIESSLIRTNYKYNVQKFLNETRL